MKNTSLTLGLALAVAVSFGNASAQRVPASSLADLSLEQLSNVEVTSVSGRAESLQGAPASIFVITAEDIRRSAAITLPQALRLAPNLQVAQFTSGNYAVSARGFNNTISNKLLVLVDGRTVYSALFSGVFWDATDVMLEDVDRIEVVSGPGGTLWGANAVNGVINVITRTAAATQGALASVTRSDSGGQAVARFGAPLGDSGHYRVYGMALDRPDTERADGALRPDSTSKRQAGFRADWGDAVKEGFTVQGDVYDGGKFPASSLAPRVRGGNLLGRYHAHPAGGGSYRLQAYADMAEREDESGFRNEARTVDLEFTHEPELARGHEVLWGAGHRRTRDSNQPNAQFAFLPADRDLTWTHVFAQYQTELSPALRLTLGGKLEKNIFTGVEFLPNLRLAFKSDAGLTWAAVSRAVRAPARLDRDIFLPSVAPFVVQGGPTFVSEVVRVVEAGQRGFIGRDLNYSITLYRQQYDRLRSGTLSSPPPVMLENRIEGHSTGVEAWALWQAARNWRLSAGVLAQRISLRTKSGLPDPASVVALGNDPRRLWTLRSSWDVGRSEVDLIVRHVGSLPAPAVPAYTAVDVRWGWKAAPALTVSLLAQNLFDRRHVEFTDPAAASQIERRVFLRLAWQL
ncbi:MAG: TonB-dependent receptor [Ramlibacter sp.]|nr:TonB-dependent receptor [Ramlibacter sp.]